MCAFSDTTRLALIRNLAAGVLAACTALGVSTGSLFAENESWYRDIDPLSGNWQITAERDAEGTYQDTMLISVRPETETICEPVSSGGCHYRIAYNVTPERRVSDRIGVSGYGVDLQWQKITAINVGSDSLSFHRGWDLDPQKMRVELQRSSDDGTVYSGTWQFVNIHGDTIAGAERWEYLAPQVQFVGAREIQSWSRRSVQISREDLISATSENPVILAMQAIGNYDWAVEHDNPFHGGSKRPQFRVFIYGENLQGFQHIGFPDSVDVEVLRVSDIRSEGRVIAKYADVVMWGRAEPGLHVMQVNDQRIALFLNFQDPATADGHRIGSVFQSPGNDVASTFAKAAAESQLTSTLEDLRGSVKYNDDILQAKQSAAQIAEQEFTTKIAQLNDEIQLLETRSAKMLADDWQPEWHDGKPPLSAERAELFDALNKVQAEKATAWQDYLDAAGQVNSEIARLNGAISQTETALSEAQIASAKSVVGLRTDYAEFRIASLEEGQAVSRLLTELNRELEQLKAQQPDFLRARKLALSRLKSAVQAADQANQDLLEAGIISLGGQAWVEASDFLISTASAGASGGVPGVGAETVRQIFANLASSPNYYEVDQPLIRRANEVTTAEWDEVYLDETWLYQEAVREAQRLPLHLLEEAAKSVNVLDGAGSAQALLFEASKVRLGNAVLKGPHLYARLSTPSTAAAAADQIWNDALGGNGYDTMAKSMLGKMAKNFGKSVVLEGVKLTISEAVEAPAFASYLAAQLKVARSVTALQAAGDAYWENYDRIIVVEGLLDGLSRRAIKGGWAVRYNVRFDPTKGLNVWLDLGNETLVDPAEFEPTILLNGVPLNPSEDRSKLHWVLPAGISFGAPSDAGLSLSILQ